MKQFGLIIRLDKFIFGVSEIDFLGHEICKNGSIPQPGKVKPSSDFPQPNTVKSLQGFLGMVNFYHRYILQAASILRPLYCSLKGKSQKESLKWFSSLKQSFQLAKAALCDATILAHPISNAPIAITTDASDIGLGPTLELYVNNNWKPLAFYSRQLRDAERKYSTYDRELLAIELAIRHFRYFLEGRTFTVYTDHKPLVDAISKVSGPWTAKQERHLSFISEFVTDKHLSGKVNVVADCLSRSPINNISLGKD